MLISQYRIINNLNKAIIAPKTIEFKRKLKDR